MFDTTTTQTPAINTTQGTEGQPTEGGKRSLRAAINDKCKGCIFDPSAAGRWREQVGACESGNCALHSVRPVPRECMKKGGGIHQPSIANLRRKLEPSEVTRRAQG